MYNINEGLGLLKLADTSLILINPSPSNVKFFPLHWSDFSITYLKEFFTKSKDYSNNVKK